MLSQSMPSGVKHVQLPGIGFDTGTIEELEDILIQWLKDVEHQAEPLPNNKLLTYINPHVYNLAMANATTMHCLKIANRVCIDGVGIKIALAFKQQPNRPRVVAEHLFNRFMKHLKFPVNSLIIGAENNEASEAAIALQQHNANLNVIDTIDGFASMEAYKAFFTSHATTPLVLIGAGTPKSEQIALCAMEHCHRSVVFHIGAGTIKTWAGTKPRGPALMSALGLEWLHRIVFEPHTRARYTLGAFSFARHLFGEHS